jgi:hypothetical protein
LVAEHLISKTRMSTLAPIKEDHLATVLNRLQAQDADLANTRPARLGKLQRGELADTILCTDFENATPKQIFNRLRWGGQVIFVSASRDEAVKFNIQLQDWGFETTQSVRQISRRPLGLPIPFFSRNVWAFAARKILLVPPGELTDRFTYHVHLSKVEGAGGYVVVKEVPTLQQIKARLQAKWPELSTEVIDKRARKFADRVFPIFLTREAAILQIVNRDLPEAYRDRVPHLLEMKTDEHGLVRRLQMQWLRNGGEALSQLEFARQSADLLRVLHDEVGIMHLDLRLDNFVITPKGVGFVDFGSAVRVDEDLKKSPLLSSLFEELMRTSEIQRMLLKMTRSGLVTSEAICSGLHKVDKAVDYFYLAVQINSPHSNPDLKQLIRYDKHGEEARLLSELTTRVLRPEDPAHPPYGSAREILQGIDQIAQTLRQKHPAAV